MGGMKPVLFELCQACIHVLHVSAKILHGHLVTCSIHQAGGPKAELILMEAVIPDCGADDPQVAFITSLDYHMMCVGGKERSKAEWKTLLTESGWSLSEVITSKEPFSQLLFAVKSTQSASGTSESQQ